MAAWDAANRAIIEADHRYGRQARQARLRGTIGSTLVIGLLLIAFCVYFLRAHRLQDRVQGLLRTSRGEAMTDVLTGLANRRALMRDLEVETADEEIVLALFDLNNFKLYNDSFGHPAGDALLARLGSRLAETVQGFGSAYRLGGDEFCMLARAAESDGDALVSLAAAALAEKGEGFDVTASFGSVRLPAEAADAESALRLADQRLYMQKDARRSPAAHEVAAALATVLREREAGLERHVSRVAQRARATAIELGLSDDEIDTIEIAGALHDIGKSAIPDSILNKPGPLAPDEWAFMHAHPAIGERIIASAPSLANVARLVRSTHERIDGAGYPDRLEGEGIPIGARIIFVCDAYDAMTADRPYAAARTPTAAIAELRRCAGSQFDPVIVEAFSTALTAAAETVLPAWVRTYGRDPARDSLPRPPLGEHPPTVALAPASLIRGGGANSSH
jgi:diguanylate cyclase (GGDEF)-like protein